MGVSNERDLAPPLLAFALILLALDVIATLWLSGRLRSAGTTAALLGGLVLINPFQAQAQDDRAFYAANNTVLAYVETGDARVDAVSRAGLSGLSQILNNQNSNRAGRAGRR